MMNPIIWRQGVCDPHAHVFEDKVYIYATHDSPSGTDNFHMDDWQIWSSSDLVNWELERTIFPEEFYCGKIDQCWAVDAAYKDGKYYWYFSTGDWGCGVGVGECPSGPFRDVLQDALVDYRTEPFGIPKWDPCVFQDDDGSAYIIVGDCRSEDCNAYLIARLADNMAELAEPMRKIEYRGNICPEDKASIHKYNGKYYLTHSSSYAISDNVYGPYEYRGNTGCNVDHGSYFTYKNQTYFASGGMDNPNRYYRASYIAPCNYRKNGEIVIDQEIMQYGSGQYDAAWPKIFAAWYFEAGKLCKKETEDGSFFVEMKNEDYVVFPNISSVEENSILLLDAEAVNHKVKVCFREKNQKGKILGSCIIDPLESAHEIKCNLRNGPGNLDLCIMAETDNEEASLRFFSFSFDSNRERCVVQPALSIVGRGAVLEACKEASWGNVLKNLNLKNTFFEAVADGGSGGRGELEIYYQSEKDNLELYLYVNDICHGPVSFPDSNRKIKMLLTEIELTKGINRIRLECKKYQDGYLAIDKIITARGKETARTYSAANGQVYPRGNGCWDGFPQRENDPAAYLGRAVKYLEIPGHGVEISGIDGGSGGKAVLLFHYSRGEKGSSAYYLKINGKRVKEKLNFPGTGSFDLRSGENYEIEADLLPGKQNHIQLEKSNARDQGIIVDGITVIPASAVY